MKMFNSILLLVLSFTCSHLFAQTNITGGFTHDGIAREYKIYIPAIYSPSTPVPVVFNLHGYGSNMNEQELYGTFMTIADTANFIIVHPNGTLDASNMRNWNSFGISTIDDIGFLSRLLDTVVANYSVNTARVYATGMSNGGYMSYELACNLNNRITAIASVTGSMTPPKLTACNPARPTPIMQIHGTADATVPYNGNGFSTGIESLVNNWVNKNNCNTTPTTNNVPNTNTTDGCTAVQYIYSGGANGASVELFKVINGGHTWPGAPVAIGVTNMDFNASKEIWRFFSQFSMDQLLSSTEMVQLASFKIYPNPSLGVFNLSFEDASTKEINIINAWGQIVYAKTMNDVSLMVDLSTEKGVYFVSVRTKNSQSTNKIILR